MSPAVRRRTAALVPIVLVALAAIVVAQLIPSGAGTSAPRPPRAVLSEAAAAIAATIVRPVTPTTPAPPAPAPTPTTTSTTTTTTTTAPPPPPAPAPTVTPPTVAVRPAPAPPPADPGAVPPVGQATAWGCPAALAYLQAYAAKGFSLECPGYAEGREAMTCMREQSACPGSAVIAIADPCPEAYMNEASNSLVVTGASDAPIDPYGPCP